MAHITGGGIRENLNRILPATVDARINLQQYQLPPVFNVIRDASKASTDVLLRTFNLGVGLALVCRAEKVATVIKHLTMAGELAYVLGDIVPGTGQVNCYGTLPFDA
jgi:phosphoribosylformylglycinamidine cyclo-ligase